MANALIHRDPGDEGIWFDTDICVGFSHRRLSILDLSKEGQQPMISFSGRYVICYKCEIYDFKDIKKDPEEKNIP